MTAVVLASLLLAGPGLRQLLWNDIKPIYARTIDHPFLKGLADGSLPRDRFDFYLEQDALYLAAFSKALSVLASRAPREEWGITLNEHAVDALKTERQLHASLLKGLRRSVEMAPTNRAYSSHLLATVHQRPFLEGLAALLPCYWVYWEVGKELKRQGSKNPDYQRWIDQYADPAFGGAVEQVLAMFEEEGGRADAAARDRARKLFEISARYEYMFWDMAWRSERWAP